VLAHGAQDLNAAPAWKHHVQDQQIEGFRLDQVESLLAGTSQRDGILLGFQAFLQGLGEFQFVFDYQNTHGISFFFIGEPMALVY
jgi:hypothetical protein